jgi:hypothetical protein
MRIFSSKEKLLDDSKERFGLLKATVCWIMGGSFNYLFASFDYYWTIGVYL